ncbi:4-aminobutyrate--2-oxoglutarate transaminase [Corynebacterium sp. sy017]|uniref:4-aminobutyrate--2-oxoglutarate transaminase n=1 Tax=unclassified Corynebacterium TaxID=2624378 RepID=UPI001185F332|nr:MULTISPECIES: 4-aminobutyrate--2-oxoglutarate transaminase [unclassified Corynebacterium]MBP3088288.1 4-aminobutyrate--2-oxoglutarate transaminase [Corynebacterium sp. sy017]QDZ41745.1 4-aminobutyrate--2-oxoglutarate transaminase [Corynebacterium sp. sy039]TSD91612.1 4-aminobutyrate--2-oxoglutarate transaminase [Corynebacterium sp. SY003]
MNTNAHLTALEYRLPQQRSIKTTAHSGGVSKNNELDERRKKAVAQALNPGLPGYIVDADGAILLDADDNAYIDLASGIAVTTVGAANPAVVAAISEAAAHFTHTCFMVSPYESYVAVAEKLAELTPGEHQKKSVLLNSGAEAVENAVKIARAYTKKKAVVVFDYAYHGRTNLTMAMTAKNKPYKTGFGPFASEIYRAPMSYPFRDGLSGHDAAARAIKKIEQEVGAENLACVVIEPIQGEGGFIVPAPGFLAEISAWCSDNNVVFIADEIQSGLTRTGKWFAVEHENVVPDLITTAKGLAGGMPLSAVTGRAEIMDAAVVGGLGGTYGGNPVACAAALAALEQMETLALNDRALAIEHIIREELAEVAESNRVGEIRGRGGMIAIELLDQEGNPDAAYAAAIAQECKQAGVLILTCGLDGNIIRLLPPLVIAEETLRDGLGVLAQAIKNCG